jgi:hypothetical protein
VHKASLNKYKKIEITPCSEGQKSRFPSYEDYRPKTNAVILLDVGHTIRGDTHTEE